MVLILCLITTVLFSVPVFAASNVTLNKTEYTVEEEITATFTGLTDEMNEDGTWIGIAPEGARYQNTDFLVYVSDLPVNNVWKFKAPYQYGKYEIRLLDYDNNLLASASFSVVGAKAKEGDITISKKEVLLREPISVTVNGLTDGQIENGAWLGIAKYDEKLENTDYMQYINDLPANNTYQFEAPYQFGKYEIRVFSNYDANPESYFGKVEFVVVSSKAKPGDIVLSKTSAAPNESMTVTVNGLTSGEIEEGAWLGISRYDEKLQNTYYHAYISDLKIGNIYEFKAPEQPGKYEVRVFCKGSLQEAEFEYALFGKAEFTVGGAPVEEIAPGTGGLSAWAAPEVNKAVEQQLVTDKILAEFPKNITREEFCELAVLLYEKLTGTKAEAGVDNFLDTDNPEVLKAFKLGIVQGTNPEKTLFSPNLEITREQISAMLFRTLQAAMPQLQATGEFKVTVLDADQISPWALSAVKFMNSNGIINGTPANNGAVYFLPKSNTTREMAISLVLRAFQTFSQF